MNTVTLKWYGGHMTIDMDLFIESPKTSIEHFCKKVVPMDESCIPQILRICDEHIEAGKDKPRILEHYEYMKELLL